MSHYINNEWIEGQEPDLFSINPATGQPCWQGWHATKQDVDAAIQAARSATESWADMPIEKGIEMLLAVDDFNSAIDEANNTAYGLAAALLSDKKLTPGIDL